MLRRRQDRASKRCNRMAPPSPPLNQSWPRRFPNPSFAIWTACERCCIGIPRNPRGQLRSPPRQRRAPESAGHRRLPWALPPIKRALRKPRKRNLTRRKPRTNRGTGIVSAGSGCRPPPGPTPGASQTASKALSLSEAANPWKTSCTLPQFFSPFIRSSQRLTFGYAE